MSKYQNYAIKEIIKNIKIDTKILIGGSLYSESITDENISWHFTKRKNQFVLEIWYDGTRNSGCVEFYSYSVSNHAKFIKSELFENGKDINNIILNFYNSI